MFPAVVHIPKRSMLVVVTWTDSIAYTGVDVVVDWKPADTLTINGVAQYPRRRKRHGVSSEYFAKAPLVLELVRSGLTWGEATSAWSDSEMALRYATEDVFHEQLRLGCTPDTAIQRAFRFMIRNPLVDPVLTCVPPRRPQSDGIRKSAIRVYFRGGLGPLTENFSWDHKARRFYSRAEACSFVLELREIIEDRRHHHVVWFDLGGRRHAVEGREAEEYIRRATKR